MANVNILGERELREAVSLDLETIKCIEQAFLFLATKSVDMPPILSLHIPEHNGEVDVKAAYVAGIDSFAIKMSPGFFDNPMLGLPSLTGLMVLFSSKTGVIEAILLDNGYLTDLRTAAAGAVAAQWLSNTDASIVSVVGTGMQARLQLQALSLVRPLKKAFVWGRSHTKAQSFAEEMSRELNIEIEAVKQVSEAVKNSHVIVTTTPSKEPLITADMLQPGQHITAMGSDADYKVELASDVITKADLFVCDRLAQSIKQGELRVPVSEGLISSDAIYPELGEIIAKLKDGRTSRDQITVCDLTGTGIQDTAIATVANAKAQAVGAGSVFNN